MVNVGDGNQAGVRGTQSLVRICAACWACPSLLFWEVLWRWSFGIPALLLLYFQGARIAASTAIDLSGLSLSDPMQAGQQLTATAAALTPVVERVALWLVPLLIGLWAIASGIGRSVVLRRLNPASRAAPGTLIFLQGLQMVALAAVCLGWYRSLAWAADRTLNGATPNLVGYSAWVITLSLGTFVLWALLSWVFSIAPLLAVLEGTGVMASLARSLRLGPLRGQLVEINLVLGVVRLALVVLAMVFSAIPLPFQADMAGTALYLWWAGVTVLYLVAGDFFEVARLAAFVSFWRAARGPAAELVRP